MEHALAELPLAIFSTLAPIASGAFLVMAIALFANAFTAEQLKKIDRMAWIPLIVVVVGFIAAFFHLTQPLNAVNVFSQAGQSPMSNEIIAGIVFILIALVYCILGAAGKLSGGLRKGLAVVVAAAGLIFAVLVGSSYMIDTIPSWNTAFVPLQFVGFWLLGGGLLGVAALALAGVLAELRTTSFKAVTLIVLALGLVVAAAALGAHVAFVGGITTLVADGSALVSEVTGVLVASIICLVAAFACGCYAVLKSGSATLPVIGVVVAAVAIFLARLVFYALEISVGL